MLNKPATYIECGRKVAKARNQKDEGTVRSLARWLSRAKGLEECEDWPEIDRLYNQGYAEERNVPRVEYFK